MPNAVVSAKTASNYALILAAANLLLDNRA